MFGRRGSCSVLLFIYFSARATMKCYNWAQRKPESLPVILITLQMRTPIKIGDNIFKYKKDALMYYRNILNSYKFGQSLNDNDFNQLIDLLQYDPDSKDALDLDTFEATEIIDQDLEIVEIKVSKVQFSTKCFEVFWSNSTSDFISYISRINRPKENFHTSFNIACRNSIQDDLIALKQKYFSMNAISGFVKCQETKKLSKWDDLAVDHRQPNTFSVIVDRFKELYNIEVEEIEYFVNQDNQLIFGNKELLISFKDYHKEKANLRIVRKECNLSRTGLARLKRSTKDLQIE